MKKFWIVSLLMAGNLVYTQEVESVRQTTYEWECQNADGTRISGHTRQDKAFQSCYNQALANPSSSFLVVGGTYRVTASTPTPPEPPQPPTPEPQVTFGPVSSPTTYPNTISALAQEATTWLITFELTTVDGIQGLASRDQEGQIQPGHLSIWIENSLVHVRHQDIAAGASTVQLRSATAVTAGQAYKLEVSIDVNAGIGLWLDDQLEDSSPVAFGLAGNDLPLVLGGRCSRCNDTQGPDSPIQGTVYMEIWDQPKPLPPPLGSAMLTWTEPQARIDDTPLTRDELAGYLVNQGGQQVASLDNETWQHEISRLPPGTHCFTVQAVDTNGKASEPSNRECKTIQ